MRIDRVWAMPNSQTFKIKPIAQLLQEEMQDGVWIDPCAGWNSPAAITNDLNPDAPTQHHVDALDFLKELPTGTVDGVIFDPPYSFYELIRSYKGVGREKFKWGEFNTFWSYCKKEIARIVVPGGKCISFGWNTVGVGKTRGFEIVRILLVCHGSVRNDTLVTVEVKKYES